MTFMYDIEEIINEIIEAGLVKLVISNPRHVEKVIESDDAQVKKINIRPVEIGGRNLYQVEKLTKTQAFHLNIEETELFQVINTYMKGFKQLNARCETVEIDAKYTKKEKLLYNRKKLQAIEGSASHNKKKNYLLEGDEPVPVFYDLGIYTKDGKVAAPMYDKFKQMNRFVEMVWDVLKDYDRDELHIIDFGCGKSYLTFVLYHFLTAIKGRKVKIIGLDLKKSVIEKCNALAKKYGYDGMSFELGDINGYKTTERIDMVVTLHACDTATDYALYNAIRWDADIILSVPCCQHELNKQIKTKDFQALTKYGIIKERVASLMTDSIRGSLLEAQGYDTKLLEFIDIEHSPKNIMIRAVKGHISDAKKQAALDSVERLCDEFRLEPTLLKLLK